MKDYFDRDTENKITLLMKPSFLAVVCFVFLMNASVLAQSISDADTRPFENLSRIKIDLDGDGKPDTVQPRTYRVVKKQNPKSRRTTKQDIQNWIAFDLSTVKGLRINSFFKYNYGTTEQGGSYWVYSMVSAGDIDGDKKTDLVFYSGDDTTDDTITLLNRGNHFIVLKKKHSTNDEW